MTLPCSFISYQERRIWEGTGRRETHVSRNIRKGVKLELEGGERNTNRRESRERENSEREKQKGTKEMSGEKISWQWEWRKREVSERNKVAGVTEGLKNE